MIKLPGQVSDASIFVNCEQKYFGFSHFRPYQKEIIEEILKGRDALVVMATGSGNYQIPSLITGKTAVVISPLISLMQDQVMSLTQRGVKAQYLGSTQKDCTVYSDAQSGQFDVLYMTPEKAASLSNGFWLNMLKKGISLLAVDEAHCISEWGHDFRWALDQIFHGVYIFCTLITEFWCAHQNVQPSVFICLPSIEYKQMHLLRSFLPHIPFIALTATATEKVQEDIKCSLKLEDPFVAIGSYDRKNLFYSVGSFSHIFEALGRAGIKAGLYHGQMSSKAREKSHRSFVRDELIVMVATIAFGMGIDKPDLRCVIHYGCPKSIESYYQESGRCGRDGLPSKCSLYYTRADFAMADFYCSESNSATRRQAIMDSFFAAHKYCMLTSCRRVFLLQYLGEKASFTNCGNCDNCMNSTGRARDISREAYLLLNCVELCGSRWGINMPIDILRGSRSRKIIDNHFEELPTHGLGRDRSVNWWKGLGDLLIAHGYLSERLTDVYRIVRVSKPGMDYLHATSIGRQPPLVLALTSEMFAEEGNRSGENSVEDDPKNLSALKCEGLTENFIMMYGDHIVQNINQMSQELNLLLDGAAPMHKVMDEKAYTNPQRRLTHSKLDTWKMWQEDGLSFKEIANLPDRPAPIKQETVVEYILEAAREGHAINWVRFCEEIGLTKEIAEDIQGAISKVGRDRLKPIKNELPDCVSYLQIKTCLLLLDLGLSISEIFFSWSSDEILISADKPEESTKDGPSLTGDEQSSSTNNYDAHRDTGLQESTDHVGDVKLVLCRKQARDTDSQEGEIPVKIRHKSRRSQRSIHAPEVTDDTILKWLGSHEEASFPDIVDHFKGSTEEAVIDILDRLESEFLIFKKNNLYKVM
ncbi:ATP-dependent DNA helicase [Nymphaea thermarum]|nr:ATP-dependent DNA helicase [Nymphaea thermarum]